HGELKAFHSSVYAESDEFKNLISLWKAELITDSTRKTYETHARLFFAWAGKDPSDMVQEDFVRYRDHLRSERRKQATIWTKFIAINRFFKFRASRNMKFKNPMNFRALNLVLPKKDRGYYSILTEQEVRKLLKAPDRRTLIGKRDYAILRLTLGYGLRVGEICKLEYQDIEKERVKGKLRVWVRDRKGRIGHREDTGIILEGEPLKAFDEWMNSCGIRFGKTDKIFAPFVWDMKAHGLVIDYRKMENGKRRDNKTVQNMLGKYLRKAGISREDRVLSPHALRHTCLTMLARAGVNVPDIGKLAAHQDINTTMIYIHNANSFDDHVGMKIR
ncbi:MAG: site-specific integrase, partial [Desulfobacteraceae bacterium]|nr:site-specific integrase [Desulfobacteraceae bacterium]